MEVGGKLHINLKKRNMNPLNNVWYAVVKLNKAIGSMLDMIDIRSGLRHVIKLHASNG
jgi:hypothetical protein